MCYLCRFVICNLNYMNRKLVGILIIFIGMVVIAGIVYFLFFYNSAAEEVLPEQISTEASPEADVVQETEPAAEKPTGQIEAPATTISAMELDRANLSRMAASFAERFGSYSNHSDYGNISDLKIFMTQKMQSWADDFIAQARISGDYSGMYYGITTKAVSQEFKEFDEDTGRAVVLVETQRKESTGTMSNASTFYQDILINFIRERGAWKVDNADWQEK